MADDTTRRDPVALFKDAFGQDSTDTHRAAALGMMMQNPKGFVNGLVELVGSFSATQFLTKISKDVSAPEPLRKAADAELGRLGSASMEKRRTCGCGWAFDELGWGEPSRSNREVLKPVQASPAKPDINPPRPDVEMQKKYRETVIRTSYPAAPIAKKEWLPTSLMPFSLLRK